jgi:NitT/TauT family transport system substrate-binding protein
VDGVAFFFFTGLLNLQAAGAPQSRFRVFRYSDYGLQGYGNAIVINPRLIAEQPAALGGFVRGLTRGWLDAIADPAAGARAVKAREPLADEAIERERLVMITQGTMVTPATRANGWGGATRERLAATIEEAVTAFGLSGSLTPEELFTDRFLSPERGLRA